jgi:hypothetical protein
MSDDGKRGIYINNDATVTSRLTQKRLTVVEGPKCIQSDKSIHWQADTPWLNIDDWSFYCDNR